MLHLPHRQQFLESASRMLSKRALRSGSLANTEVVSTFQAGDNIGGKKKFRAQPAPTTNVVKTMRGRRDKSDEQTAVTTSKRARMETPESLGTCENRTSSPSFDRPAEPHRTNAPLITPRGSRLTYPQNSVDATSQAGNPRPATTTENVLEQACAHLIAMEPKLQPLIEKHYCHVFCREGLAEECDPFKNLVSGIMAQQVSGAAASSIKKKFIALFDRPEDKKSDRVRSFPTPTDVAACSVPFLRQAGLSGRKAEYIKGLAEKFASGELGAAMLINASDEEVLEKLIAVRGLGRWSVVGILQPIDYHSVLLLES